MVSVQSVDIGMDVGETEGGAVFGNVPGDHGACTADQFVAQSGPR